MNDETSLTEPENGIEMAADEPEQDEGDEAEGSENVVRFPVNATEHAQLMRITEALLFAAAEPLDIDSIAGRLPEGADVGAVIEDLQTAYQGRGVTLVRVANKWMFRTADDLSFLMEREAVEQRRLSRAGMETLAIVAYH
ncbi:MAG: SMC-Scp complex subunit ScpB, partial [Parvibaculum sp.]|nr:SMC-Scp complex subunit ScpB [Parvibaculum sp.]